MDVIGIGVATPTHSIGQSEAATLAIRRQAETPRHERLLRVLYERSGVQKRHSVALQRSDGPVEERQILFPPASSSSDRGPGTRERMAAYERHATPLASAAARRAMRQSGIEPAEVTHLVTVSCTGFSAPGVDIGLIRALEFDREVARTNVGFMGCHGMINAIGVARAIVRSEPEARVLVCALELCSLHLGYGWERDRVVTDALFADGAAAMVAVARGATTAPWRLPVAATASILLPDSDDAITWRIGDNGFEMTLSPGVPGLIRDHVPGWLAGWLATQGARGPGGVRGWAVHPGGPKVLDAFEESLELPSDALQVSRRVLARHGNMSSATIGFILEETIRAGVPTPIVAVGFGPGMVAEAVLFATP